MKVESILGIYGAIVSTILASKEIYNEYLKKEKLKIKIIVGSTMGYDDFLNLKNNTTIENNFKPKIVFNIENTSKVDIDIKMIGIHLKDKKQKVCLPVKLPINIKKGLQYAFSNENIELADNIKYIYVVTTNNKKFKSRLIERY